MALTLVPEHFARVDASFIFNGANAGDECQDCPVKALCFDRLTPGRRYAVQEVRDVQHPCNLHDDGRVTVVDVVEIPFTTSAQTKRLRGTATTWNPVPCGMPECGNYALCHPAGIAAGEHYEIVANEAALPCPAGYELRRVQLRGMPTP